MQILNTTVTHCGFVAIIGRPNVGKSTLLNKILGQKISITSNKAQTTRHRILGIDTQDNYQAIYLDTPGLHSEEKRTINKIMNRTATSVLTGIDLILFIVEVGKWQTDDELVLSKLANNKVPVVLVINKIDKLENKQQLLPFIQELQGKYLFKEIIPISAEDGDNVEQLKQLVFQSIPKGEHHFDADEVTDRTQRFMAAEIVREKLTRLTGDELPYSATVEIESFKIKDDGSYLINALILVERDGQKKIVIGKQGQKIKQIGITARQDMQEAFDNKVHLELWVKVKSGWADDERALQSLGYIELDN